ncbi:glycosyltransferase family 2 protein [Pseudomonas sp. PDM22]|nr:glycosyltransferase family 2 protein [Pseudomonas sp. PDM22]OQR38538.1 glycosyl transferase family 2 [Pseudomonas sp. T]
MSTYNGESFLGQQLDSLIAQSHPNWVIFASDDGSSDSTLAILAEYQTRLGDRLVITTGPGRGFAANFLSLLRNRALTQPYIAFCDQDDLWDPERLRMGLQWVRGVPDEQPALFCSRTRLIDQEGHTIGFSPLFERPPCFENALVQSIAGGNTMLLNRAAQRLLAQTPEQQYIVSHDWWAYLLISGCGGAVEYCATPTVGYRQHPHNLVGSNSSLQERLIRVRKLFTGTFRAWMSANIKALTTFRDRLTPENQRALALFEQSRHTDLSQRLTLIRQSGVHRQTLLGTVGLAAAAIFQRV